MGRSVLAGAGALLFLWAGLAGADPDTRSSFVVSGRFAVAGSACAVQGVVVTNAHVVDPQPFDPASPLLSLRYEAGGVEGVARPVAASNETDLALLDVPPRGVTFAAIAREAPKVGDPVWWATPSHKSRGKFFTRKVVRGKVVAVRAGVVVIDEGTDPGSSGGCVFAADGSVVGLVTWAAEAEDKQRATLAVGLWGVWWQAVERLVSSSTTPNHIP